MKTNNGPTDISSCSLVELKALAFEVLERIEIERQNLSVLKAEMQKRLMEAKANDTTSSSSTI